MNKINRTVELDLANGRDWLGAAESAYSKGDNDQAIAAAAIGNGYVQLAAVGQWAAARAEDLASAAQRRIDDEPGVGTARLAALIGEGLVACEPHPLLHSYTQRYIASVLRGEPRRELTGLEADLNG